MKRLTPTQRTQFFDEGWVMVPDLFDPVDLEPLREEIANILDTTTNRLHTEGKITNLHADAGFEQRLTRLIADNPDLTRTFFAALEGKGGGGHVGEAMFNLLVHPNLLDAMEDLVGEEIVGSSVYRIRPKVPKMARGVVPWHQDSGYLSAHCDREMIVTCWIPLVDATPENGCLQVLPRVHKEGIVRHHTGGNAGFLVITDDDLPQTTAPLTVPVPRGGALLMTNLTPHQSLENHTDVVRWSVDLRYQAATTPNNLHITTPEEAVPDNPAVTIACYAPEGDFIVRSRANPQSVADYTAFVQRRTLFENSHIPSVKRGWQPVGV